MKKITLTIIIGILILGLVSAGIGIGAYNKSREMDKIYMDELLSKTDAIEINPNVIIDCSNDYCLWGAYQKDIIQSYNNNLQRYWMNCTLINETTSNCINEVRIDYTDNEIQNLVAEVILSRLEIFADASINREFYEDWGTGSLTINEEK